MYAEHLTPPRRHPALPTLLVCALMLLCGMAAGGALTWTFLTPEEDFGPPPPGSMPAKITNELEHELALTADQKAQVLAIFQRGEEEVQVIRQRIAPEMEAQFDKVEKEVAAVLTPEQVPQWHERCQKMRERFKERRAPKPAV